MTLRHPLPPGYEISTDPGRLDLDVIHPFLTTSYWSPGIPLETVERAIAGSMCFGLYGPDGGQVGFARIVSDRATFAYLADVFVDDAHRGKGLGKALMAEVMTHPDLQGLRRWMLATADAHALYAQFGFGAPARPDTVMFRDRSPAELYGGGG